MIWVVYLVAHTLSHIDLVAQKKVFLYLVALVPCRTFTLSHNWKKSSSFRLNRLVFVPLSLSFFKMREILDHAMKEGLGTLAKPHLAMISRSLQVGVQSIIMWLTINGVLISCRIDPRLKEEDGECILLLRCSNRDRYHCKAVHRYGHFIAKN